ncbi:calcium-binding protein [Geminicoccus harenae]|uniref:calcium-binding protein n=1 Tax=Geminicoccus harenae TaxID=2498453 RepID=UPI00168A7B84|nr:calcium-binding protein [Geminicoccus harenae]
MADIHGTRADERLVGTPFADMIFAGRGHDTLLGLAGRDRLNGGSGNDSIHGGSGADRLFGDAGDDIVRGGHGRDYLWGGSGDDHLQGGQGNDVLRGNSGDDVLRGGQGSDLLDGGSGADLLYGGSGIDSFIGGAGIDMLSFENEVRGVYLYLGEGPHFASWRDYATTFEGPIEPISGIEQVRGSSHDDVLHGFNPGLPSSESPWALFGLGGDDVIWGGALDDHLEGNAGNDEIDGFYGDDVIEGGAGDDRLNGRSGDDRLTGGSGSDVFEFRAWGHVEDREEGNDTVVDFASGTDRIELLVSVAEDELGNISFELSGKALFDVLDSDSDNRITALDDYATVGPAEGRQSLTIDLAPIVHERVDPGHFYADVQDLKLTVLGVTVLSAGDFS